LLVIIKKNTRAVHLWRGNCHN